MKVDALGFNLHLFSQRYVEELFRSVYPYARVNDVTPFFFNDVTIEKQDGIYYAGMLQCTAEAQRDGAVLHVPRLDNGDPSYVPVFTLFDHLTAEGTFIGWKISLDGGIEPPVVVDPPPPDAGSLISLINGEFYMIGVDSPLNYEGSSALAFAFVEPNQYVRRVCLFGVVGGFTLLQPDDRDITGNNVRVVESFGFDPGPAGTVVGVVASNDAENLAKGARFDAVTNATGDVLPFSYSSGVFTWLSPYDSTKWDVLITPYDDDDIALDSATIVSGDVTQISTVDVAYYKVILRRFFANQWLQAPDLLIAV